MPIGIMQGCGERRSRSVGNYWMERFIGQLTQPSSYISVYPIPVLRTPNGGPART